MRAGVEPERIVAGTLLLLVAAGAGFLGSAEVLALLPASGMHSPLPLAAGLAVVGFAAALTWLSVVVLAGRHSQRALALATVLVAAAAAIVGLGGTPKSVTILLLGVAVANTVALLIGNYRLAHEVTRTPAWHWSRLELGVGVGVGALVGLGMLMILRPTMWTFDRSPWKDALLLAGFLGIVIGLAWMIRILRDSHDERPPWRYRDH